MGRCNTCCDDHHCYRSQTKLRRLCFYTCLSFCSQGGFCLSACWDIPPGADPPGTDPLPSGAPRKQTPLSRRPLLRTVRILLECILVDKHVNNFHCSFGEFYVIIRDFPKWRRTSIKFRESDKSLKHELGSI